MTNDLTANRYGSLCAEIYDLDKPPGALNNIDYYKQRLAGLDGPVLEAAVGTGRLLIPLLEAGVDVIGFDHSADMLSLCRRNCEARSLAPDLRQARFQDFSFDTVFAAVTVPVSSFIFVHDFDEALAVLRRFAAHLRSGGRLYIELPRLDFLTANHEGIRAWTALNGDLLRMDNRHVSTDMLAQTRTDHAVYERWRDSRLIESELEVSVARLWGRHEFEMALREAGFVDVEVTGNYRGGPPRPGNGILNYVAVKPNQPS